MLRSLLTRPIPLAVLCALVLGAPAAHAYIYSLPSILTEIFDGRKPQPVEVEIRHRVGAKGKSQTLLREKIYWGEGRTYVMWEAEGGRGGAIRAAVTPKGYEIGDRILPRTSRLFLEYMVQPSPEEFQKQLLAEQFVRRDQLIEFKPGFNPKGHPRGWKIRDHYLRHPDIFHTRLPEGVTIVVVGLDEGADKRLLFIDKAYRGLYRLEWREEGRSTSWTFDQYRKFKDTGSYPRRLSLERGGVELVSSEIIGVKPISPTAWQALRKSFASPSPSVPAIESALELLLSYR